jgi:hypothetical protein
MRIASGFVAAALGSAFVLASGGAQAGCCNTAPFFFQPFGCCAAAQPQVIWGQPQTVVVQPQVIVQQVPVVQSYMVNQGPVYSGPGADYSPAVYEAPLPVPAYPYLSNYHWRSHYYYRAHRPRPYVSAYRYPPHHAWRRHKPVYKY